MPSAPYDKIDFGTDICYRRATLNDIDDLIELGRVTFTDTFGPEYRPEDLEYHLSSSYNVKNLTGNIQDPFGMMLVAEIVKDGYTGPRLVAFSKIGVNTLEVDGAPKDALEYRQLYVRKELHGSGVAHEMMRLTMRCLLYLGGVSISNGRVAFKRSMYLGVWEKNSRAQRFYAKWGFEELVGTYKYFVGDGGHFDVEHMLSRAKDIDPQARPADASLLKNVPLEAESFAGVELGAEEDKCAAWKFASAM